jgi:WD40 repeat protein
MNFSKHWAATLDDYAIDLAWSPDGSLLAVASAAGGITLYAAATGALKHTLPGHADGTNCLAWLPSPLSDLPSPIASLCLATGGQDGCVRFWNATSGLQTAEIKLGSAWVEHLAWMPISSQPSTLSSPLLFAAAGKNLVALRPDGSVAHTFPDAPKTISALAISPFQLSAPPAPSSELRSPASLLLAVACFGHVAVYDATTFAVRYDYTYGNAIYALLWSPDGRWLIGGCHDNAVHLWVPAEDNEFHMSGYETRLKELAFSPDSKWLATGGGRDACVWDCSGAGPEGREPLMLPHSARTCAVAFQHTHSLLATGSTDGEFCLWSPARKNPLVAEVKMPSAATKFAWSPNDTLLAVGTERGAVFVFRAAS